MPCEISWEPLGVYRRLYGIVSFKEIKDSIEEVGADPRFDELRYSINDFSGIRGNEVSYADLEYIAAVMYGQAKSNSRILIAIVMTDETAQPLIERLRWLNVSPYAMQVFPTVVEARNWIERELPIQDPLKDATPRTRTA